MDDNLALAGSIFASFGGKLVAGIHLVRGGTQTFRNGGTSTKEDTDTFPVGIA